MMPAKSSICLNVNWICAATHTRAPGQEKSTQRSCGTHSIARRRCCVAESERCAGLRTCCVGGKLRLVLTPSGMIPAVLLGLKVALTLLRVRPHEVVYVPVTVCA